MIHLDHAVVEWFQLKVVAFDSTDLGTGSQLLNTAQRYPDSMNISGRILECSAKRLRLLANDACITLYEQGDLAILDAGMLELSGQRKIELGRFLCLHSVQGKAQHADCSEYFFHWA